MNSALGASTAEVMYGDVQMCTGDRAGPVLVAPFQGVQKGLQAVLPSPIVMGDSQVSKEGVAVGRLFVLTAPLVLGWGAFIQWSCISEDSVAL